MKSKTALSVICCLLTVLCLCLTACQTSSITVIDAETHEPVADAMVFAYCHDFVAFPRQRLYTTDDKGEISFVYQAGDSFWIGKPGYYPFYFYPGSPYAHGFLFWFTFPPTTIKLHPVKLVIIWVKNIRVTDI